MIEKIFGSRVDWLSQHSVFPEYFRQQFYDTGNLFSEFAANVEAGKTSIILLIMVCITHYIFLHISYPL